MTRLAPAPEFADDLPFDAHFSNAGSGCGHLPREPNFARDVGASIALLWCRDLAAAHLPVVVQLRKEVREHRAHFVDGDPSSALRAWGAYLAAAPEGTFAPEAHYNRAVTLVRLGRLAEARQELEPFARGAYGGYRAREAAALLDAIALRTR